MRCVHQMEFTVGDSPEGDEWSFVRCEMFLDLGGKWMMVRLFDGG